MGRKTTVGTLQLTNKWNITLENLDIAKKGKPKERNGISPDGSSEQHQEDQLYQGKNREDET